MKIFLVYNHHAGFKRALKNLPFHLAKTIDIELGPIGLSDVYTLKSKGTWFIRPTTIRLSIGDIITRDKIDALSTTQLRDYVRARIEQLIDPP